MKIILKESQLPILLNEISPNLYQVYADKINSANASLDNAIKLNGTVMINIENGKEYLVYYNKSLSDTIGKNYCICRLIKDNQPYGQTRVESMDLFMRKN